MTAPRALRWANLALLVLFPIAWAAPLLRAGFLPLFGLSDISVLSGLRALWSTDAALALLVTLLALVAPLLKTIGLALLHHDRLGPRWLPLLAWAGKFAMADVFLLALYVVILKGVGIGRVETAWGLWLFTGCILASVVIAGLTARRPSR